MNIAVLHPQCRVRGGAIKMALLSAQSLQKQGHRVMFYTFEHDSECFPELQEGLTIVAGKTTKHTVDTVDKPLSFWKTLQKISPRFFSSLGIAWDIRQVDIVIAHNPPMQIVGALAKFFSFFSSYHQQLTVIWWHHHIPWYYTPKYKGQNTKDKIAHIFSPIAWKGFFERYFVLPRIKYLVATSHYTAFCLKKYCRREATVIHPVITQISDGIQNTKDKIQNEGARPVILFTHGRLEPGKGLDTLVKAWKELQIQNTKYKIQSEGTAPVIPAKDEVREVESRGKQTIPSKEMKGDDLDSVSEHGMTDIRLVIAGDGSLKNWLIEQGATVIPYQDGLLDDIKKTHSDILAIYLSTIDAFGMAPLEAQIAGLPAIILDKGGARETVLLDNNQEPIAQLIDTENEILPAITYFIQQRSLQKRMTNVNFCHQREYFTLSRLDADIRSLIDSVR